jgi:hypothetical protein
MSRGQSVLWLIGRQLLYPHGRYYDIYKRAKDYYKSRCQRVIYKGHLEIMAMRKMISLFVTDELANKRKN